MKKILNIEVTHWLPILTYCPENNFPDFVYVKVRFTQFIELYAVRKKIRQLISGKTLYMETIANIIADEFPNARTVTVRLAFNKHVVTLEQY